MNYYNLNNQNEELTKIAVLAKKENNHGKNYLKLLSYTRVLIYSIPKKYSILQEENIADFYIYFEPKLNNYIRQYDPKLGNYLKFISTVIYRWASFYKIRCEKQTIDNNYKLNIYCKYLNTQDTYYESIDETSAYIVPKQYDEVNESISTYNNFTAYSEIQKNECNYLRERFDLVLKTPYKIQNLKEYPKSFQTLFENMKRLKNRKHLLIYILTIPNAILQNYTKETAILFNSTEEIIIDLLTHARLICLNQNPKKNKEVDRGTKYLMKAISLKMQKQATETKKETQNLQHKIQYSENLYKKSIERQKQINNKHISQRKLAKALDIRPGTIASSILSAKSLLNNCLKEEHI